MLKNVYFDTCVYHQPGIDLLTQVIPVENILFGSEMVGAVRGIDPNTGHYYDDTKRYVDALPLERGGQAEDLRGQCPPGVPAAGCAAESAGALMNTPAPQSLESGKSLTMVIYALYAASFVVGVTAIIAIIMNYVKKDDVAGSWLESHFRWQIRTFWFALLWCVIGVALCLTVIGIVVGAPILFASGIWVIYRIVKGWLRLSENKPMYQVP